MSKKLKTLDEHNSTARIIQSFDNKPNKNGIACPKCGSELYDSNPMITLASFPAKKNIACMKEDCGYIGYRIE
jgi:C4-type Zn-finger protein